MHKINEDFEQFRKLYEEISATDYAAKGVLNAQGNREHNVRGVYPYIAYQGMDDLWELFESLSRKFLGKENVKFLDVGAGTGRIVDLARKFGFGKSVGVEFYEPYVIAGRKFHKLGESDLLVKDAFKLNYDFLKDFNVIYTYMPIRDGRKMCQLHCQLVSEAGWNTIFVEMLPRYYPVAVYEGNKLGQALGKHYFTSFQHVDVGGL